MTLGIWLIIIGYIISVLVIYGVFLYHPEYGFDEFEAALPSMFWPICLAMLICISPFWVVKKIVTALKNRKEKRLFDLHKL